MKKRIGIVFGGNSVEHEISILSLIQASHAIDTSKYEVLPIYLTKEGEFWVGPEFTNLKTFQKKKIKHYQVAFYKKNGELRLKGTSFLPFKYRKPLELIIPIVHGKNVEDGSLAGFFKIFDTAYASSDILPAALFQNKHYTKKILSFDGLPVLPYLYCTISDYKKNPDSVLEEIEKLNFPVIIKPVSLGSSIGIKVAENKEELQRAINYALKYEDYFIVERKLAHFREFNQALLERDGDYELSAIEEVKSENSFLTFSDKYLPSTSKHEIPALISTKLRAEISRISMEMARNYCFRGVVRIDYLYDLSEKKIYVNEVNTIPGSLAYYLFEEQLSYPDLIDVLIKSAFRAKYRQDLKLNSFASMVLSTTKLLKK
ncbi:MAG TPA: hypothetical protein GX692_05270 [Acholeplasmataceae bacterium]|nr:hypothetical protein [Acholeplasmataceae bacterium]